MKPMMLKLLTTSLVLLAFSNLNAGLSFATGALGPIRDAGQSSEDWPEQDRIDRSYPLGPGTRVEISTIYGPVDIETSGGDLAEIHIVRFARAKEDLTSRRISIEQTATGLVIRGEKDNSEEPARVRHRVRLRIPRHVELAVEDVNGHLNAGEIDGSVRIHRVNGAVRITRAGGHADLSRINGTLAIALTRLALPGLRIERVNGSVDLRFAAAVDADLSVDDFNGGVNVNLSNTAVLDKSENKIFRARIGAGGVPISISNVNGSVTLAPAG